MKRIDYNKINSVEKYYGKVVEIDNKMRVSRIKVRVKTVFDDIPTEYIPWAMPRYLDGAESDMPAIGDIVPVKFLDNDLMYPMWYRFKVNKNLSEISDEDYPSSTIIKEKDLSKYGLDGKLSIRYTKTDGVIIQLDRNDKSSTISILNDNTILATNGNSGQSLHLANDNISIGSKDKSQQPAVVGDDNLKAFQMLNDTIKDMASTMETSLQKLSTLAGSSPYTKHLQLPFKTYAKNIKEKVEKLHKQNGDFFPETKSKCVTIDKTID